ncbi:hypothetical protein [Salinirussus salinus]|uniref:hypothetical protein n=1 Tax=Salinirussus salinus TaxID=1198300 RepID=UPI00135A526B|nr:hypothetical protein [Salinirussus salinus]
MNVLHVTVDCLRRDRCGLYGHHRDTTPTLDALECIEDEIENYAQGEVSRRDSQSGVSAETTDNLNQFGYTM